MAYRSPFFHQRRWDDGRTLTKTRLGDRHRDGVRRAALHLPSRRTARAAGASRCRRERVHLAHRCVGIEQDGETCAGEVRERRRDRGRRADRRRRHLLGGAPGAARAGAPAVCLPRLSRPDPGGEGARHSAGVDGVPRPGPALHPLLRLGRPDAELRRPRRAGGLDQRILDRAGQGRPICAPPTPAGIRRCSSVIDAVDETFIWAVLDRPPITRWTYGRVTMLGDACHPMIPFMGQGGAQAIEDAAALTASAGPMRRRHRDRAQALRNGSAAADDTSSERVVGEPDPVPYAGRARTRWSATHSWPRA